MFLFSSLIPHHQFGVVFVTYWGFRRIFGDCFECGLTRIESASVVTAEVLGV